MSILDVTEDQIFHTLGRGKDPNFKPIEKVRPVIPKPKKTYTVNQSVKPQQQAVQAQVVVSPADSVKPVASIEIDESMIKLTEELSELNSRITGIQKMVKWYIMPQFVVVVVLLLALILRT